MLDKRPSLLKIYWILMKPRVVFLLQATAICGVLVYDLSEGYKRDGWNFNDSIVTSLVVLLGGSLASGGSMAINMWYERDIDPFMKRTAKRPIHWLFHKHVVLELFVLNGPYCNILHNN